MLIKFYQKVEPARPGWARIRRAAGISLDDSGASTHNIPLALLGWTAGCACIWSGLSTFGNLLHGRMGIGLGLFALMLGSRFVLLRTVKEFWVRTKVQNISPEGEVK